MVDIDNIGCDLKITDLEFSHLKLSLTSYIIKIRWGIPFMNGRMVDIVLKFNSGTSPTPVKVTYLI